MHYLFEKSDSLNTPVEAFVFDTSKEAFPVKAHWHHFIEIILMSEGTAQMYSGDKTYYLSKGDMIIFHPKTIHAIYATDGRPLKYSVLKFDINKISLSSSYSPKFRTIFKYAESIGADIYFPKNEADKIQCRKVFADCTREAVNQQYGYDEMLRGQICILLMNIIRKWMSDGMEINHRDFPVEHTYDIDSITEYIDSVLCENLKVSEIAKKCGMSYSCFAKKFREVHSMSCKQYIERMRIFKAEEFLLFTDYDLSFISQETGFSDCSHLIKSFKQIKGVTPKRFRAARRT